MANRHSPGRVKNQLRPDQVPVSQRPTNMQAVLEAIRAVIHVFLRPPFQSRPLFFRELANNFGRRAQHERTGRNFCSLRHQRLGTDQRLPADHRAIQNDRTHANQNFVAHFAGVNNRGVTHGDPIAQEAREIICQVQHRVVLDV